MVTMQTTPICAGMLIACWLAVVVPDAYADPPRRPTANCDQLTAKAKAMTGSLVNLNSASEAELKAIPGVGTKVARAIVDRRKTMGAFKSIEQLRLVSGVGEKTYACLSLYGTVDANSQLGSTKAKSGAAKAP